MQSCSSGHGTVPFHTTRFPFSSSLSLEPRPLAPRTSAVRGEGGGTAARRSGPSRRGGGRRASPGLPGGRCCAPRSGRPPRCPDGSRQPRSRRRVPSRSRAGAVEEPIQACPGDQLTAGETAPGSRGRTVGRAAGGCAAAQRQPALSLPAGGCRPRACEGRRCSSRTGRRLPGQPVQVDAGDRSLQMPGRCWRGREGAPSQTESAANSTLHTPLQGGVIHRGYLEKQNHEYVLI